MAQSDRDDRISAVVGLDASFVTAEGGALMAAMGIDLESISASVLSLHAKAKRDLDPTAIGRMHLSDRYHVALGGTRPPVIATHFDFQNWPLYSVLTGVEDDRGVGARPSDQASRFFRSACRLTLHFMDYVLKRNEASRAYLIGEKPLPEIDTELVEARSERH